MSEPTDPDCLTAFLVVQAHDGAWYATPTIHPVSPLRRATVRDLTAGCNDVLDDIHASKTAQAVINRLTELAVETNAFTEPEKLAETLRK
ncbi:hypothetical protein [Streptomyces sp. CBMA29]|uniref:hypothetical protein n=1 Tax=Streptomyces sp. CBMA29 TaxID=1896314 RepID=UPI001661F195|nr:hypothetical protein [Streptomyces sp. CBMA29]MBD0734111.1 hypothetical protein [Streptomyces sp. CBMA29]